ncbi:glyoxalase [Paractinoplanes atraurantiacus]|uniref:glyoxalase n=1 Tax=Paractinoplanes atraurantiacus TaxID=1036182 RepID=UPI000BE25828|nr:glyoxalase [Actinoplanes atraurantiacus]
MTFVFERLHHIQVLCPPGGEDVARGFYAGVLGLEEFAKPPALAARGGCWFRGGGWEIHVSPVADFAAAVRAHPGVLVNGLEGLALKLETAGRPVEWDHHFPGHRRFYSQDDHGNRLEFLEAITG